MTAIPHTNEPDHSKAHEVYVALDLLTEQIYSTAKATPGIDFTEFGVSIKDAVERAGAVFVSARFQLPLIVIFETAQARYRLVRTRQAYRCEVAGPARRHKELTP